MEGRSVRKFFNQFIKRIKKDDIKRVGIITDKDGTLLLDESLKQALRSFNEKKLGASIYLIGNSGRTVQDMINCLKDEDIPVDYFDYIIGDNGSMCLDVRKQKELYKHVIDRDVVLKVINKFIEMGGTLENIRLANGKNIFVYPSEDVKQYYKDAKDVIFTEDVLDLEIEDTTKLTLTGPHSQIVDINRFIRENIKGYKTHKGSTYFPEKSRNNYRIDFTRNAYKRKSCIRIKRTIGIGFMYIFRK